MLPVMSPVPAAEVGLRRVPRQARSRARVDAIIAALVELVSEVDTPGKLTTADVAARADLPLGSLYEYFEDLDSIVDATVARMLQRHDELLDDVAVHPPRSLTALVDVLMDAYLRLYREEPAFVSLRMSVLFQPYHRDWLNDRVRRFVRTVATTATSEGILPADGRLAERLDLVFSIGDAIIIAAYRDDPKGDQLVIDDGRVILRYAVGRLAKDARAKAE